MSMTIIKYFIAYSQYYIDRIIKFLLMHKSQKQNNLQLPKIKQAQLQVCKDFQIPKPKLTRILYSPIASPNRLQQKITILETLTTNRNYDDLRDQIKERQIQQFLRSSKKAFFDKEDRLKIRVGKQAQIKYYDNYKKLAKIINKKKLAEINNNLLPPIDQDPATLVLQQTQNLQVLPCCMGFVKTRGEPSVVDLSGQKFGDRYIKAISTGLKQSKMIQSCIFSNNRLTDKGFSQVMQNMNHQIIKLNLSHNRIAKIDQKMLNILVEPEARLQYLNLQNNLLSDRAVDVLCKAALSSRRLKYLNIRKNILTKKCAESVSQLVLRSGYLQQLYIGMNRIYQQGAISILQSLQENRTIKVFDYSMNKLGNCQPSSAKALAEVISNNKTLVHVDFSGNNYNEDQSKIISQKLHKNKKIYGFHFSGNYGYVDSKGFLQIQNKQLTSLHSIVDRSINSYDIVFRRETLCMEPTKFRNVCWICQGWYQQTFKFFIPEPRQDGKNFVYIHFDFQEFEPRLINITQAKVKYKTMVPPRKYRYFFTWNSQQFTDGNLNGTNKSIGNENKSSLIGDISLMRLEIPLTYTYEMNHENVTFKVQNVSCRTGKPKKIVNNWDQLIVSVLPRQEGLVNKKQKKPWSYKDSLWSKQWKLDDEQLTKNCFQKDWKSSKLSNLIKNPTEQQKVKQLLYKNYKLIKQLYRYYSSLSPFNGDIWAVSSNAFTQFCNLSKITTKDAPFLTIIDLTFITTNSISGADLKGNPLVPERGLIRFQFMEGLVRLSQEKFKKNGLADSILGSVFNMIKDHIQPLQGNPICSSEKWRLQNYFCQQNDMLVKKYRPIFTELYKKNSKMKVKPGNKPFMCLAEFKSIIQRIGIAGSMVLERDIFLSFNCSMMTQVDQLENQRFIRMTQIEFIQAVARCAYILPNTCKTEDIFQATTPFYAKFEWIIHQLKSLCSQQIKNNFMGATSLFNKSQDD